MMNINKGNSIFKNYALATGSTIDSTVTGKYAIKDKAWATSLNGDMTTSGDDLTLQMRITSADTDTLSVGKYTFIRYVVDSSDDREYIIAEDELIINNSIL